MKSFARIFVTRFSENAHSTTTSYASLVTYYFRLILNFIAQSNIEDSIFRLESSYLDDTGAGNIIKGFDNYMKGSTGTTTGGGMGTATRRKGGITEADRIFSRSSAIVSRVCFCH